jgi:hypothetical protein
LFNTSFYSDDLTFATGICDWQKIPQNPRTTEFFDKKDCVTNKIMLICSVCGISVVLFALMLKAANDFFSNVNSRLYQRILSGFAGVYQCLLLYFKRAKPVGLKLRVWGAEKSSSIGFS